MTRMPGGKSVIKYYNLEEEIIDMLFHQQISYDDIIKRILEKHNVQLNTASISNFRKMILKTTTDFLENNEEYRERLAKKLLDTTENLIFALDEIKKKIEQFSSDPDEWKAHVSYVNAMLPMLNMILRRAGEIKPTQIIGKQQINMMQINNMVQDEVARMIDEKLIPLEQCAPQIQEFYRKWKKNENTA